MRKPRVVSAGVVSAGVVSAGVARHALADPGLDRRGLAHPGRTHARLGGVTEAVAQEDPAAPAVEVDEHRLVHVLHEQHAPAAPGVAGDRAGLALRGAPAAVVGDLDAERLALGPEGELDVAWP